MPFPETFLRFDREPGGALGENLFAPYRERVLFPIATVGAAMFLPLALLHYVRGDSQLALLLLFVVALLAVDALAIRLGRRPPVPFPLLLLPGAVGVALSIATQGSFGVFWAYPTTLFAYFALPRRFANATAVSFLGMTAALVYLKLGEATMLRFVMSMGLCILVVNIILGVLEAMQARLLEQSLTDPLTGAFNRRQMNASLSTAIERHRRTGAPATLVMVDVDHFKTVNDRFGHHAGDRVLHAIVQLIRGRCRRLDMVFRMGGEEFVVLMPDTRSPEAARVAEELRRTVATAPLLDGRSVTLSMGVSELRDGDDFDTWMRRVDEALYVAKRSGRDRVLTTGARPALAHAMLTSELQPPSN